LCIPNSKEPIRDRSNTVKRIVYAQVCTHPDLAFITVLLRRFQSNPRMKHFKAANKVLHYMQETKHYMPTYKRTDNLDIIGYSYADFAGRVDSQKSTSGYVFTLASGEVPNK
jgi:hypothetical protein